MDLKRARVLMRNFFVCLSESACAHIRGSVHEARAKDIPERSCGGREGRGISVHHCIGKVRSMLRDCWGLNSRQVRKQTAASAATAAVAAQGYNSDDEVYETARAVDAGLDAGEDSDDPALYVCPPKTCLAFIE